MLSNCRDVLWFKQQCLKLLPYAVGIVILFLLGFSLYVRSMPPKQPKQSQPNMTAFADLGQTPYDAVPPDAATAGSSAAGAATPEDPLTTSSSDQATASSDPATIEL